MSTIARERPGVYSDYDASGVIWGSNIGKIVGIVASTGGEINTVYTITRLSDAKTIFGETGLMIDLCNIAFQNGASQIAAVSAGSSDPNYAAAFAALAGSDNICAIVCDSTDVSVQTLLKESVVSSSENCKERIGIISLSSSGSVTDWANNFNCERLVLTAQIPIDENGNSLSPCLLSAALAGAIANTSDPSTSFNGIVLSGITGLSAHLSEDYIDSYIQEGITVFENIGGEIEIIRAVTSRTTTDSVTDKTFKELNTILIIDTVLSGIRSTLKNNISGSKNNSATRTSIATQTIIELENYMKAGFITSYDSPLVYQDSTDSSICIVEIKFNILHAISQIKITAHVKV